jgi:hypothetical protein
MGPSRVVVRYQDGQVLKGFTSDFLPNKEVFHLAAAGSAPGARPAEVRVADLKAVFFVKDFGGHPEHQDRQDFDGTPVGRRIRVVFKDGELLVGTTQGYPPGRPGFFVVPADPTSNNERCFVMTAATREVGWP